MTSFATLYVSYFGLREPLVQTQVLPYLRGLRDDGVAVHLLTFEPSDPPWPDGEVEIARARLAAEGIRWFARRYHRRPSVPATVFDIVVGVWSICRLARRYRLDALHARSHVPLAMTLAASMWIRRPVVFDFRGLLADEYVAGGRWRESSFAYRAVKRLERLGLRKADQFVVLTRRARDWMIAEGVATERIECVPCCVDLERFPAGPAPGPDPHAPLEIVHLGSVSGAYRLDLAARFAVALRAERRGVVLKVLTPAPRSEVWPVLEAAGLTPAEYALEFVKPAEIGPALHTAAAGLDFMHRSRADLARSPARIAEYLAAGALVVVNAGIGDLDDLLADEQVGVVVKSSSPDDVEAAAARVLDLLRQPGIRQRCRDAARRHFDLATIGVPGYRNVYRRLRRAAPRVQ